MQERIITIGTNDWYTYDPGTHEIHLPDCKYLLISNMYHITTCLNHEELHAILQELEGLEACVALDNLKIGQIIIDIAAGAIA